MTTRPEYDFLEAAKRGLAWILTHQRPDGSFCAPERGIGGYYKVPYLLTVSGHLRQAQRLLSWVAQHHFTSEGDFRAVEGKAQASFHDSWPVYGNAWLILGAHRAGRWDLSQQGITYLLRYQVPVGGFYALDGETHFLEPVCTSWGGLAALTTGQLGAACRAGDLLTGLATNQPEPDRFYYRLDLEGNLITEVPPDAALFHYIDATRRQQIYYNPGIILIFLAHLHRATAKPRYLEAGRRVFQFTERCADDVHRFPPSGKLGMGSALLYSLTGQAEARQAAINVGAYLVKTQTAEGFWRLPDVEAYNVVPDKDDFEIRLDLTTEFCIFLTEIAALI